MEQRYWPRSHDELSKSPIQVRVATVEGLFNPMDPTPLDERAAAAPDREGEDRLAAQGIEPERPPYSIREGGSLLCFVRDPDNYRIELIERNDY